MADNNYIEIKKKPLHPMIYSQIQNHDFEFVLLTDEFQEVHTPVMCKDYIQDIVWAENVSKNDNQYGLNWEHGWYDINRARHRMAIYGGGENMRKQAPYLKEFLNAFEDALGIEESEVLETTIDDDIVINFSKEWLESGPMISAFTTLIRISGAYKGGDVREYLKEINKPRIQMSPYKVLWQVKPDYMEVEVDRLPKHYKKILALLEGKRPEHEWDSMKSMQQAHYTGIIGFNKFPTGQEV